MKLLLIAAISILSIGNSFAIDKLSVAFKSCLNQNIQGRDFSVTKSGVRSGQMNDTDQTIISINCSDDVAQSLYEEVKRFSNEKSEKYIYQGFEIIETTRSFGTGKINPTSQCREFNVANGQEYYYACNLVIDLVDSLVKGLNL